MGVTEHYPPRLVVRELNSGQSTPEQVPWVEGLVGGGYRAPPTALGPSTGRGTNCHTTGDFGYHPWADGPACLGLRGWGTAGTRRSCAPAPKAL